MKNFYDKNLWLSPNKFYANELQNLFAGENGEMPCFLQFFYQANFFSKLSSNTSEIFQRIATEDLAHSQKLAECIVCVGGNPEYKNSQGQHINFKQKITTQNINEIITQSILMKEKNVINLKSANLKISNIYIKHLLNEIIQEEEYHLNYLRNILNLKNPR